MKCLVLALAVLIIFTSNVNCQQDVIMMNNCGETITFRSGGYLELTDNLSYKDDIKCTITMTTTASGASSSARILLIFSWIDLEPGLNEGECFDFITISNVDLPENKTSGTFCGKVDPSDMESIANDVIITFQSDSDITKKGFALNFASFTNSPCGGQTNFDCGDGRCISESLTCDNLAHCENASDEAYQLCGPKEIAMIGPFTVGQFIILLSGCFLLLGISIFIAVKLIQRKQQRELTRQILKNMDEDDPLFT